MEEPARRQSARRGTKLSSRWLASAVAGAYVSVSTTIGISMLAAPEDPAAQADQRVDTSTYTVAVDAPDATASDRQRSTSFDERITPSSTGTTTTTATPPTATAPAGFKRVSGPAGVETVIPTGWSVTLSTGPGAMQATDPADSNRFVKYGGSVAPLLDIAASHIQYENLYAERAAAYQRIELSSATYGGHPAVEWEFEHNDGSGLRHVRSLYWRAQGNEYFVFAAGPAARWAETQPIYDAMVAHSAP